MIKVLFASDPSFTEQTDCNSCKHSGSYTSPLVTLHDEIFSNDFSNLENAIIGNFLTESACKGCKNNVECKREFGPHIFVDVNIKTIS